MFYSIAANRSSLNHPQWTFNDFAPLCFLCIKCWLCTCLAKSNGKVELNCFPVTSAVWFTHPLSCSDSSCGCLLQGELNVKRKHTLVPVTADWALGHILQDSETSIMSQSHSGMENAHFRMQSDCRFNRVYYRFCLPFILTPSSLQSQWICAPSIKCCTIVQQKMRKI